MRILKPLNRVSFLLAILLQKNEGDTIFHLCEVLRPQQLFRMHAQGQLSLTKLTKQRLPFSNLAALFSEHSLQHPSSYCCVCFDPLLCLNTLFLCDPCPLATCSDFLTSLFFFLFCLLAFSHRLFFIFFPFLLYFVLTFLVLTHRAFLLFIVALCLAIYAKNRVYWYNTICTLFSSLNMENCLSLLMIIIYSWLPAALDVLVCVTLYLSIR